MISICVSVFSLHYYRKIDTLNDVYYFYVYSTQNILEESPHDVVVNGLDYNIIVSKFKLQSHYHVNFQTNIFEKCMNTFQINTFEKGTNSLMLLSYGLNSTTTVILQRYLWHEIIHEGWYGIKQRNQTIILFFKERSLMHWFLIVTIF